MRKFVGIACILSIVIALIAFAIYNDQTCVQPLYYNDINLFAHVVDGVSNDENRDSLTNVSAYHKQIVKDIFEDLSEVYNFDKPLPNIGYYHTNNIAKAQYFDGCIYIDFSDNDINSIRASIAHELIHYFTDDDNLGFDYTLDNVLLLGHSLTEGITNYFSTKYAANDNYLYETHVAKLLAICYGEDALKDDFFYSVDVTNLRKDFNKELKKYYHNTVYNSRTFMPFDVMTLTLNSFTEYVNKGIRNEHDMLLIEEMMLFYAYTKGCEDLVVEEIMSFAKEYDEKQFAMLIQQQAKLTGR